METTMNLEPVLLSKINIHTGNEEAGMIPADFQFQCALPDEAAFDELVEWIAAYFERRDN